MRNPFTPGFGNTPPVLAGREDILAEFADAIDDGPGSLGRATLYTGARGTGKTVMLNEVGGIVAVRGWLVVHETATPGFVTRLVTQHLPALLREHDPNAQRSTLTGVNGPFGIGGVTWDSSNAHVVAAGLRNQLELLCDLLAEHGTGLLITLDEVHRRQSSELRDFFTALQHLVRDDRQIAFAAAGLPSEVSDLLSDEVLTFLRRADRHTLGGVGLGEVERTLRETIEAAGRTITASACARAATATGGYPFLIQLVGHHIWRQHPDAGEITDADVAAGVPLALRRMGSLVHEPALKDLSHIDRSFLFAMALDDGSSKIADIATRLGVNAKYAGVYRQRLLDAQMIQATARGRVGFTLPYLRDYLREHGANESTAPLPSDPNGPPGLPQGE
ncbi:MAG: ATP-binding protein [Ilumatobacteraceae bacterium]|nr:ATP-binding protein [Ilumatobacteraceae bacterium]